MEPFATQRRRYDLFMSKLDSYGKPRVFIRGTTAHSVGLQIDSIVIVIGPDRGQASALLGSVKAL